VLAVVERLYGATIPCGARRDLALESDIEDEESTIFMPPLDYDTDDEDIDVLSVPHLEYDTDCEE
jgi:hypothetical protein